MTIIVCDESLLYCHSLAKKIREIIAKSKSYSDISLRVKESAVGELWQSVRFYGADLVFWTVDSFKGEALALAKSIFKKRPDLPIVFITGPRDEPWPSFGFYPFRCLKRELPVEELQGCLSDALEFLDREGAFLTAITRNERATVRLSHVIYVEKEKESNYLLIHCGFETYRFRGGVKDLIGKPEWTEFVQISQSMVVNMNYITSFKQREVVLSDQTRLPVFLSYTRAARSIYEEYLGKRKLQ